MESPKSLGTSLSLLYEVVKLKAASHSLVIILIPWEIFRNYGSERKWKWSADFVKFQNATANCSKLCYCCCFLKQVWNWIKITDKYAKGLILKTTAETAILRLSFWMPKFMKWKNILSRNSHWALYGYAEN